MDEHRELTTYRRLREQLHNGPPAQTIRSTKLYHRQVYSFAHHRPKLALMRESPQHRRFAPLSDFLEQVPKICPRDLFSGGSRASQLPPFVTVAAEIPIWLTTADIDALEIKHDVQLLPEGQTARVLTGHMTFCRYAMAPRIFLTTSLTPALTSPRAAHAPRARAHPPRRALLIRYQVCVVQR
jgi:hypothetical protein